MERDEILNSLSKSWDLIIVGGGITGAGIFNEASKQGLSTLLLEQRDFGWGTSSRSGKLVHGGLRYLKQGQIKTTWHSVKERERLLVDYKYLVEKLRFLYPTYKNDMSPAILKFGLDVYDFIAGRRDNKHYDIASFNLQAPLLVNNQLTGGFSFTDAITDDARLVLRVIEEGKASGGIALNYLEVVDLIKDNKGRICGVNARDSLTGKEYEIFSQVVINATGVFADNLRSKINKKPILRRLRGSHIIFPHWRFPVYQAISFSHPDDGRPLYVLPWNGVTLFGTTDLEHDMALEHEPRISKLESDYLFAGLNAFFPSLKLTKFDAISTFSGIRPVINTGKVNPSKESRDYILLADNGLITVTGGKLTTFKLLATDTMKVVKKYLNKSNYINTNSKKNNVEREKAVPYNYPVFNRLQKTFGDKAFDIYQNKEWISMGYVDNTDVLWAELFYSAKYEQVVHLEDLLLRRSRIGLIMADGGVSCFSKLEEFMIKELKLEQAFIKEEKNKYLKLWQEAYSPKLL